jgi:hypothetical protein
MESWAQVRRKTWAYLTGAAVALFFVAMQLTGTLTTWTAIFCGAGSLTLFTMVATEVDFRRNTRAHYSELEAKISFVRTRLLRSANFSSDAPAELYRYHALQVTWDSEAAVLQLAIETPAGTGLQVGSELSLIFTDTDMVYGTVIVARLVEGRYALAVPRDRANRAFWDDMERRADTNPAPPDGFHLEAFVPNWLRDKYPLNKRVEHGEN